MADLTFFTAVTALLWTAYQEYRCRTCPYYPPNNKIVITTKRKNAS